MAGDDENVGMFLGEFTDLERGLPSRLGVLLEMADEPALRRRFQVVFAHPNGIPRQ